MGFNLEQFFKELEAYTDGIIKGNDQGLIEDMHNYIIEQKQYAIECGMIGLIDVEI